MMLAVPSGTFLFTIILFGLMILQKYFKNICRVLTRIEQNLAIFSHDFHS
jgi:hypothetical protein